MNQLEVLQVIRVKGRCSVTDLASALGAAEASLLPELEAQARAGFVAAGATIRLTPEGTARLQALRDEERADLDLAAVEEAYDAFTPVNSEVKSVISSWQLRPDGSPNDHTDGTYDAGVIAALAAAHDAASHPLALIGALAPRMERYPVRLGHALAEAQCGNSTYVARPIMDSYHTVWFELHEDLIGLAGRTRAAEAAAGRAV